MIGWIILGIVVGRIMGLLACHLAEEAQSDYWDWQEKRGGKL